VRSVALRVPPHARKLACGGGGSQVEEFRENNERSVRTLTGRIHIHGLFNERAGGPVLADRVQLFALASVARAPTSSSRLATSAKRLFRTAEVLSHVTASDRSTSARMATLRRLPRRAG
jgi:hypothetical protein